MPLEQAALPAGSPAIANRTVPPISRARRGSICHRSPKACVRSKSALRGKAPSTRRCSRLYEKTRDAEAAAVARANALSAELAAAQSALAAEQHRSREMDAAAGREERGRASVPHPRRGDSARRGAPPKRDCERCAIRSRRATPPSCRCCIRSASATRSFTRCSASTRRLFPRSRRVRKRACSSKRKLQSAAKRR